MNKYDDEGSEWTPWFDDANVYDIVKGEFQLKLKK